MEEASYERSITVPMVPHVWIASGFGPILLFIGVRDFSGYEFYISIFFLMITFYSIYEGMCAFKQAIYSDFIMLAIIPITLPIAHGLYLYSINT